jgi:hypothetical protein
LKDIIRLVLQHSPGTLEHVSNIEHHTVPATLNDNIHFVVDETNLWSTLPSSLLTLFDFDLTTATQLSTTSLACERLEKQTDNCK